MRSSGVLRYQDCFDECVQPVQIDVGQNWGDYAPNAMDNFCFEVTLGYRRLERPRRRPGKSREQSTMD